nr:MAG TPA: stabilization protein [Caudoviricetes sp.]
MATTQPLKGGTNKIYSVINNFNKGIDRRTADDVAVDSTFKELKNFYDAKEGVLSKRPGIYDANLTSFLEKLPTLLRSTGNHDGTWGSNFKGISNKFNESAETLATRLEDFNDCFIDGNIKTGEEYTYSVSVGEGEWTWHEKRNFQPKNIIGFQTLQNNNFFEFLKSYEDVAAGTKEFGAPNDSIVFSCIILLGGYTSKNMIIKKKDGSVVIGPNTSVGVESLMLTRMSITIKPTIQTTSSITYTISLELDSVDPTNATSSLDRYYLKRRSTNVLGTNLEEGEEIYIADSQYEEISKKYTKEMLHSLDMVSYNGYTYLPTGKNCIIRIKQDPTTKQAKTNYPNEVDIFEVIGLDKENLYKPTALELTQIGFNVLAYNPLNYYQTTGTTSKVKGVFYSRSVQKGDSTSVQPISKVPYNDPFNIHIIYTGSATSLAVKYRPNTGDTDTTTNPFKTLPGTWDSNTNIFECTGLDSEQAFEIQITLGDDVFLTYLNTTSSVIDETADINQIHKLILSSERMKLVGNQLVLYGGHGYMFFSEYDEFTYFPNYYYLYLGNGGAEEQVVGISYFRQYYAIFTNKQIKRMTGTFGADNFGVYPLNDFVGCSNGNTIRAVGNNLFFLGSDGIYTLKQGYLGEGTENVEKVDVLLGDELNSSNVLESFTMNNNYIIVKNDGKTWFIYDTETGAFYEYDLEALTQEVYNGDSKDSINEKIFPFFSLFETKIYDKYGNFFVVPMYNYTYNSDYTEATFSKMDLRLFRFSNLEFLDEDERHQDGAGFISELETHNLHLGYPTNNKKFKDIYIKLFNDTEYAVPLYITVWVDDRIVVNPVEYQVKYNAETDTYYYVSTLQPSKVLGEFILGKDTLGNKTVQQIKIRVGQKGKAIKIKITDGFDDTSALMVDGVPKKGIAIRNRNTHNFAIASIGISYKVKKVKEG